ncbi:MAG TPA: hypothetical protein VGK73_38070, partial [Polyangiaceae bacterium]
LAFLRTLPGCSVDACVTDPPYGLSEHPQKAIVEALSCWLRGEPYVHKRSGFMGAHWDAFVPGPEIWREVFRVLKPGAHAVVFSGTRTIDLMGIALRLAGFEIRDTPFAAMGAGLVGAWVQGQGFAKSKKAHRAIAMELCELPGRHFEATLPKGSKAQPGDHLCPDAPEGAPFVGYGTGLAPKYEPILLVRKPLDGTIGATVLKHGTGTLAIDACRVAHASPDDLADHEAQVAAIKARGGSMDNSWKNSSDLSGASDVNAAGRWAPNFLLVHDARCKRVGTVDVAANPTWDTPNRETEPSAFTGKKVSKVRHANGRDGEASADRRYTERGSSNFAPLPGARRDTETVEQWECVEGCPVRELDMQSGEARSGGVTHQPNRSGYGRDSWTAGTHVQRPPDTGTAARYFPQFQHDPELDAPFAYVAKAARAERDRGLQNFRECSGGEATARTDGIQSLESPRSGAGRGGGIRNNQPTIKPIELIRWLARLVKPAPRDGAPIVVVPFGGAGSEIVACLLEGYRVLASELNNTDAEPFVEIARARIHHVEGREFVPRPSLRSTEPPKQSSLFRLESE